MNKNIDMRDRFFMDVIEQGKKDGTFPCGTRKLRMFENPDGTWTVNMAQIDSQLNELDCEEVTKGEIEQRLQIGKIIEFLKENYAAILEIVDCMRVGVWITDGNGTVMMVNNQSESTGGLPRNEIIGRTMDELIEIGYVLYESSVLKAIKSRKEESIVQALGEGGHLLATSVPIQLKS